MLSLIKSFAAFLISKQEEFPIPIDSTFYEIETKVGQYQGQIIYQDDLIVRLKTDKLKPVKILKSNISKIIAVDSGVVGQYFQKRNAQLYSQHSR
jgi:hypothetical protein